MVDSIKAPLVSISPFKHLIKFLQSTCAQHFKMASSKKHLNHLTFFAVASRLLGSFGRLGL